MALETLDASKPDNCTMVADIDDYIRENRSKINEILGALSPNCESLVLAAGENTLDVTAKGRIIMTTPEGVSVSVVALTGAVAGQTVVLMSDTGLGVDSITVKHDPINGPFLQSLADFEMHSGEFVVLHFCEVSADAQVCERVYEGIWVEVGRSQTRSSPNANVHWISVNDQGAPVTEVIA